MMITSNVLDPVHPTLDPSVFDAPDSPTPTLKPRHLKWIKNSVTHVLTEAGYDNVSSWLRLILTGSLTTYQYSDHSDVDVSLFVDTAVFPEWSRADMISVMVNSLDGKHLPGTPHPMQNFVVPQGITPEMLYSPGIRSGYDLQTNQWIVPPERTRAHDVQHEMNAAYRYALLVADKMEMMLRYDHPTAIAYWHMIHKARQRDMRAGKGDYALTNIVYKFLDKKGLFPEISQVSGEYIAKVASPIEHQTVLDANRGQNLTGLPGPVNVPGHGRLQFHSHGDIQRIAQDYMNSVGMPYNRPNDYVRVDPERAAQIAAEYERMPHVPSDPSVKASYDALKAETLAQYQHAVNNGYKFEFYPEQDPYPNSPREAVLDLHHNKHMYVYPTETGYGGGEEVADHPMLEDSGLRWNDRPVTHNDLFRAVHDFYGHAKEGVGFRADGEENAWRQHSAMFSPQARPAMTAETRGQNSWVNFGPYGEHNQTAGQADTVYAPQKAGIMSDWTQHIAAQGDVATIAYQQTLANGGVTINVAGQRPTKGFAFSPYKHAEVVVSQPEFTPDVVDAYIEAHREELENPDNFLGIWIDNGSVYIDISTVIDDRSEAYARAPQAGQLAMFDLGSMQEIPVLKTAALQNFQVDPDAVEQARDTIGLQNPVAVNLVGGTHGQYMGMQNGTHYINLVSWLRPESASKQLWHEMAHALQAERDPESFWGSMQDYHDTRAQGHDAYSQHPWEIEANQLAANAPFSLVANPDQGSNDGITTNAGLLPQPIWGEVR
jgi:hypothetical protein